MAAKRNGSIPIIPILIVLGIGYFALTTIKGDNGGGMIPAGDVFGDIPDQDLFGDLLYL